MSTGVLTIWTRKSFRPLLAAIVIALAGVVTVTTADARLGGGGSFGSRGSRTYSAPSATTTAPRAAPIERSTTAAPYNSGFGNRGGIGNNGFGASRPGFFGSGLGRGILGGLLGAGLFGMLFGHGLTGGLGGGMSMFGLILQLGLLFLAVRFIMNWWRNRQQRQAYGGAGGNSMFGGGSPAPGGFGGGYQQNGPATQTTPIEIGPDDYQAFERRLVDSQAAYSNGDLAGLRRLATPEMAGNFERELADNASQGVVNKISDVRLAQGDLSEAWRENNSEYATVAMRFSLVDVTVEKQSGRVVSGNPGTPQDVTEVWTFQRPAGSGPSGWALAAIQQS